jgi:hypothetical protein
MTFGASESPACIVENLTIRRCMSAFNGWGGGIRCEAGASPTLRDLIIEENISMDSWWESGIGGGIYCDSASPTVESVLLRGNLAYDGGGLACAGSSAPILNGVTIQGEGWSGLALYGSAAPVFGDVLIEGCSAAIIARNPQGMLLENLRVVDNSGGLGVGLYVHEYGSGYSLTLRNSIFSGCTDGAIYCRNTALVVENVTFLGCRAEDPGAVARLVYNAVAEFRQCIVMGSRGGVAVNWDDVGLAPSFVCCDFFANEAGNVSENIADPIGTDGNFAADPVICGIVNEPPFEFTLSASSPCLPENNACGLLIGAEGLGCGPVAAPDDLLPASALRAQSFPNPMNPSAQIEFVLPVDASVSLRIYDGAGRLQRTLLESKPQSRGVVQVTWDGSDDAGQRLPSGTYLYEVEAAGRSASGKLTLLK